MKFAFKFSMPKWERPKQEAPYISNPLINELEKVDFASLTAERRQDILHRLKLACASIAEDRRHQPAILSDRIRLQKMWQDYFRIAQTTPAGDNQGENLSVSRYSGQEEEQKPRALGAVMTMQEEMVAAANFKIDLGGLNINDMDDMDDFSPSSIPRATQAPASPPPAQAPAPHAAAAHLAASRLADAHPEDEATAKLAPPKAPNAAEQELAEQMAKIKAVTPMALPPMAFPNEPAQEQTAFAVVSEPAFSIELSEEEPQTQPVEAAQALSPDEELAEQMARIKAVAPMALPPMAFPSDPAPEQAAIASQEEAAFSIEIGKDDPQDSPPVKPVQAQDLDEELAEQMAKIKAVAPMALPPMPHPADRAEAHSEAASPLVIGDHGANDHPDIPEMIEEDTLHIHDGHLENPAPAALTIDAEVVDAETVTVVKAADEADASGFRPLTITVIEEEAATLEPVEAVQVAAEIVEAEAIAVEVIEAEPAQPESVEAEALSPLPVESPVPAVAQPAVEHTAEPALDEPLPVETAQVEPVQVEPVPAALAPAPVPVEAEQPAEPKPKRSRKASALATLRSMLSPSPAAEPTAAEATPEIADAPDSAANEVEPAAPVTDQSESAAIEAALPPKEREVSATPSTKEWVNIKLLRPSVIRGLPLPDQVITIVPYTEAKRLEENGSAIILSKPRTPRSPKSE